MILMAIDHCSAMVARTHFTEMWGVTFEGYPTIGWWFSRFVSHICAPGFFFLMGISMLLFAQSRLKNGWSINRVRNYFLKRGSLILLIMFLLEFPSWALSSVFKSSEMVSSGMSFPGKYNGGFFIPTTVLYGLGMCMLICSFLLKLKKDYMLLIAVASFGFSTWYITNAAPYEWINPFAVLFYVPGLTKGAMSLYPVIPWLGVTAFGIYWAHLYTLNKSKIFSWSLIIGLVFLATFFVLRIFKTGNFQLNDWSSFITFFTLIKYPPSLVFIFFTLGVNLILLFLFSKIEHSKYLKPIKLFGQTAMFFYIVHLYLYALLGAFFPSGCSIYVMYTVWFFGLIILYFICNRFLIFKHITKPTSFWRIL